jgi:hypothetical protein
MSGLTVFFQDHLPSSTSNGSRHDRIGGSTPNSHNNADNNGSAYLQSVSSSVTATRTFALSSSNASSVEEDNLQQQESQQSEEENNGAGDEQDEEELQQQHLQQQAYETPVDWKEWQIHQKEILEKYMHQRLLDGNDDESDDKSSSSSEDQDESSEKTEQGEDEEDEDDEQNLETQQEYVDLAFVEESSTHDNNNSSRKKKIGERCNPCESPRRTLRTVNFTQNVLVRITFSQVNPSLRPNVRMDFEKEFMPVWKPDRNDE